MKGLVTTLAITSLLVGLLAAQGCKSLKCGPGTVQEGSQCVRTPLVSCGPGTQLQFGVCVALDVIVVVADSNVTPDTESDTSQPTSLCPDATATSFCISGKFYDWKGYKALGGKVENISVVVGELTALLNTDCQNTPLTTPATCTANEECGTGAVCSSGTCIKLAKQTCFYNCKLNGDQSGCDSFSNIEVKDDGSWVLKNLEYRAVTSPLIMVVRDTRDNANPDPTKNTARELFPTIALVNTAFDENGVFAHVPLQNYEGEKIFPLKLTDVESWGTKLAKDLVKPVAAGGTAAALIFFADKAGKPVEGIQLFKGLNRIRGSFFNDDYSDFVTDPSDSDPQTDHDKAPATSKAGAMLAFFPEIAPAPGYQPKPKDGVVFNETFAPLFAGANPGGASIVTLWWESF